MKNKNANMQLIFDELSEKNQDLMILLAKSIMYAQEEVKESFHKTNPQQIHYT